MIIDAILKYKQQSFGRSKERKCEEIKSFVNGEKKQLFNEDYYNVIFTNKIDGKSKKLPIDSYQQFALDFIDYLNHDLNFLSKDIELKLSPELDKNDKIETELNKIKNEILEIIYNENEPY